MVAAEVFHYHFARMAGAVAKRQKRIVLVVGDDCGIQRPWNRAARAD